MIDQIYNIVKQYGDIDVKDIEEFINYFTVKTVKKGEFFYNLNKPETLIGLQLSGIMRYFSISESGEEITTDICRPKDIITTMEMEDLFQGYIQALEDSEIVYMNYSHFDDLFSDSLKWQKIFNKMLESCLYQKGRREVSFLSLSAKDRYIKFLKEFSDIKDRVQQIYIASYLGISPVSLSRLKKSLN